MANFGYLQDAGTIVMALKSEKVKTNQITALVRALLFQELLLQQSLAWPLRDQKQNLGVIR